MPLRSRTPAGPSPAVRARVAALFGLPGAVPEVAETEPAADVLPDPPPSRRTLVALAGLAVLAATVTGAVVWRGRPTPVALPPLSVSSAPSASAALLVVDVAGDVRRPGLVRLPPGSRVADAVEAAGGLRRGATTTGLNLARKLVDGEQVLVGAAAPGAAAAAAPGLLSLNAATAEQLDELPGIGPVLADRIVEWRTAHGPFGSVDQLREVSGIGARKFETLKDLLTL